MNNIKTVKLYSCLTDVDAAFVQEAETQENKRKFSSPLKRIALIAAIIAALLLCGFTLYQTGLFDPWFQKPSASPVETVQSALENEIKKEYTICVQVYDIAVDQEATERAKNMYKGSDLAQKKGWTDAYIEDNMIVVRAEYYVEYDHTKTFLTDGEIKRFYILIRDEKSKKWKIWDNTTPGDPFH